MPNNQNNPVPEIVTLGLVIPYKMVFGDFDVSKRLDFINGIPAREMLHELASLNYRLKPPIKFSFNTDPAFQVAELSYFCGGNIPLVEHVIRQVDHWLVNRQFPSKAIIFNRPANLFAMQEILASTPYSEPSNFKWSMPMWENFLRYYLCVNEIVGRYEAGSQSKQFDQWEHFTAGSLFLNELSMVTDPILTLNRFVKLLNYFEQDAQLKGEVGKYFNSIGLTPEEFIKHISSSFFHQGGRDVAFHYHYTVNDNDSDAKKNLTALSRRGLAKSLHEFDFIDFKKSPFYKESDTKYLLLDNTFLIEKAYENFLNDFWFDYLKPKGVISFKEYRGKVGDFFQTYISGMLKDSLSKFDLIKTLGQLKIATPKGEVELTDLYGREKKKILLGEIKSSGVYSEKYEGTAQALFKNDREFLYQNFGLTQLIKSIEAFCSKPEQFEAGLAQENFEIYPLIILNEKIFQTTIIPRIFQDKLNEELKKISLGKCTVHPLTLVHISDLETMKDVLKEGHSALWEILQANYTGALWPRPLQITLSRIGIKPRYTVDFAHFAGFPKE